MRYLSVLVLMALLAPPLHADDDTSERDAILVNTLQSLSRAENKRYQQDSPSPTQTNCTSRYRTGWNGQQILETHCDGQTP